jgi:mannose-6-phosphate isomerase-like protein (cupin superfamily)
MTNLIAGEAAFVDPTSVPVLNHLDFLCRVVLPGEATAGRLLSDRAAGPAWMRDPRHVHAREAETFIVLDGALEGWCEGQASRVEAGQLIHVPVDREHAYRVVSDRAHY